VLVGQEEDLSQSIFLFSPKVMPVKQFQQFRPQGVVSPSPYHHQQQLQQQIQQQHYDRQAFMARPTLPYVAKAQGFKKPTLMTEAVVNVIED